MQVDRQYYVSLIFIFFQDVIENDDIRLDTMFKLSIAVDICQVYFYIFFLRSNRNFISDYFIFPY